MQEKKEWSPGLENDHQTLQTIISSLDGSNQEEIPKIVRLIENPKSPIALHGAIDLFGHDCLHVLLGRGLSIKDEAFVVGFTMGSSRKIKPFEVRLFKLISRFLYPKIYRFTNQDLKVYDLGFDAARQMNCFDVFFVDFRKLLQKQIGSIRSDLNIDTNILKQYYTTENELYNI